MSVRSARFVFALALAAAPIWACTKDGTTSAAATKPLSPAEGAADYQKAGGPHDKPTVPTVGGPEGSAAPDEKDCPPKCAADGSWIGCGLKKPRGSNCAGCTPKCKGKGSTDEGWYDCAGVLIVQRECG